MSLSSKLCLRLYTTLGCHLCEQAENMISSQPGIIVQRVEIADDTQLLARYGLRIPVLSRPDTGQELDWPFDAKAIISLIGAC